MVAAPVTVVIPAYNAAPLVCDAINSVLQQTSVPQQIIVVDDGSRDDTPSRVAAYGDRVSYVRQSNAGVAAARNTGVARATQEYVAFLDADDVWHPRKIELQLSAIAAEGTDLAALGTETFDWPVASIPGVADQALRIDTIPWSELVIRNRFTTSAMLVRRSALSTVGPFDIELRGPEDHDLWLRLAERFAVGNLLAPLTGYRNTPLSLSKQAAQMEAGMQKILAKLDERNAWRGDWLTRQAARAYVDYSCAYMYSAAGMPGKGLLRVQRSLARYPLPFKPGTLATRMARLKLAVTLALATVGVYKPNH